MPTTPTPIWLKKHNLTQDLYDIVKPRLSYEVKTKHDGLLRAVSKETIQMGYRRVESGGAVKGDELKNLVADLYDVIKPRVSVWVQTNQDKNFRSVLSQIIKVGYRKAIKAK